jgi:hypothetical protein
MDPVTISIVGTGTGDGGGVAPTPNGTLVQSPAGQPDLIVNVVKPSVAILIRFVHLFLTTFVGVLTAAGIGGSDLLGTGDFTGVVRNGAWLGLSVSGMGLLKDVITVFGRLEGKYPLVTGSI